MSRQAKIIYISPFNTVIHKTVRKDKAKRYAEAMLEGNSFPPVKAYRKHFGEPWKITDGAQPQLKRIRFKKTEI